MKIRSVVSRLLFKQFGYRFRFLARTVFHRRYREQTPSFGLLGLDSKIIEIIDTSPNWFVELGANDGISQSNSLALELFFGWRGILIEPVSASFDQLKHNRNGSRNHLFQKACVGFDFPFSNLRLAYSTLMTAPIGLESDIEDPIEHAQSGVDFLTPQDFFRIETAPTATLTDLLLASRAPQRLGLLSLDVEGAELEVLKGIDFQEFRFSWIVIECRQLHTVEGYLRKFDYCLVTKLSHHDYLFVDKPWHDANSVDDQTLTNAPTGQR